MLVALLLVGLLLPGGEGRRGRLSVLLVTSPCPDNPSTQRVHRVVDSLSLLGLDLDESRLLIVCDGFRTRTEFRNDNPW